MLNESDRPVQSSSTRTGFGLDGQSSNRIEPASLYRPDRTNRENRYDLHSCHQVWNWQTSNGNFNMPLTLRVGRVFKKVKPLPLNISMQAGYTPDDWHQGPAAKWQFLFNVTLLIPQG